MSRGQLTTNNRPMRVGFAELQAMLDYKQTLASGMTKSDYFGTARSPQNHAFGVYTEEWLFQVQTSDNMSDTNSPHVISHLNGFCMPDEGRMVDDLYRALGSDKNAELLVSESIRNCIRVIGMSTQEHMYDPTNRQQQTTVQIHGIAGFHNFKNKVTVGGLAEVYVPTPEEIRNIDQAFAPSNGMIPNKVILMTRELEARDVGSEALRQLNFYISTPAEYFQLFPPDSPLNSALLASMENQMKEFLYTGVVMTGLLMERGIVRLHHHDGAGSDDNLYGRRLFSRSAATKAVHGDVYPDSDQFQTILAAALNVITPTTSSDNTRFGGVFHTRHKATPKVLYYWQNLRKEYLMRIAHDPKSAGAFEREFGYDRGNNPYYHTVLNQLFEVDLSKEGGRFLRYQQEGYMEFIASVAQRVAMRFANVQGIITKGCEEDNMAELYINPCGSAYM